MYRPSSPLCIAMTYFAQYDSNGVAKEITHPDRLKVLHMKSSYADVVSVTFLRGECPIILLQVSLSASKDNQRALETGKGGALRWVSLIQLVAT